MQPILHRATLTLGELQSECLAVENGSQGVFAKLVHLQAADLEVPVNSQNKFNEGRYVEIGDNDPIQELKFIPVEDPNDIPTQISDQLQDKFLLIFDELLYVQDNQQRVLGFGRTS
jgi:hypothetical protein